MHFLQNLSPQQTQGSRVPIPVKFLAAETIFPQAVHVSAVGKRVAALWRACEEYSAAAFALAPRFPNITNDNPTYTTTPVDAGKL